MKKMNLLSKAEMKRVLGGNEDLPVEEGFDCKKVGSACTGNVQCCSNVCKTDGSATTGASCASA
ncbi:hypothetical protein EZ428_07985 [Pedobacter frigiditerrae]|uniref:Bacteriocin-type signal sequence-containing protein n=1 Tax=Pedobacter frigiditerrae TaxID=2530452 RepID=A0A4R0MWS9_9SPHI|nr:hypothetical protein [Pedobacter frigiditerrae]TCC91688.1 hypothetical protein EZ428_07985 [Pedobacter frigiditerrae]